MELIFDEAAEDYDAARPGYPGPLVDDLLDLSGIVSGGRILEIGAGTGQLTLPIARKQWRITALEPGPRLAAIARDHLAPFPRADVVTSSFEDWHPGERRFSLVVAATALHHVEAAVRFTKAAAVLEDTGALGVCVNFPADGDRAWREELDAAYTRHAPALAGRLVPVEQRIHETVRGIEESGRFGRVEVRRYSWAPVYDATRYCRLLRTYADHLRLPPGALDALTADIQGMIERHGGAVPHTLTAVLFVARRA